MKTSNLAPVEAQKLHLYNTLEKAEEAFSALKNTEVGIYACGPTVYDYAHIGNLRTYLFEDILKRALLFNGYAVRHVINITDVGHLVSDADEGEDKMTKALKREGKPLTLEAMKEIADIYTRAFKEDFARLNILPPDIWCAASEHIPAQIALIERLEQKGYTYRTRDGIYFDTGSYPEYGKLAGMKPDEKESEFARIANSDKRSARDFALWKFNEALGWESPWGRGFPGWHIECSAMSMQYLGESFDIHCGGIDHIPIHHTNEMAQSEAATEKPLARFWVHGNFLQLARGVRMGKSEGNLLTVKNLEEQGYDPLDFRYLTFTAHYRSPLAFSIEALDGARTARKRLNDLALSDEVAARPNSPEFRTEFAAAINNDLDLPRAIAAIWKHTGLVSRTDLIWADQILGLKLAKPRTEETPTEIGVLIKKREQARAAKNWAESDILRDKIIKLGWTVEDSPDGPRVKKL